MTIITAGTIVLFLTVVMAPDKPDVHFQREEPSIEQCWTDAKEFVAHGVPVSIEGAKAVAAACLAPATPGNPT